jgi:hypothetical protein
VWHPVGPKSDVLVLVELLAVQAQSHAESLLALNPDDRQARRKYSNLPYLITGRHGSEILYKLASLWVDHMMPVSKRSLKSEVGIVTRFCNDESKFVKHAFHFKI